MDGSNIEAPFPRAIQPVFAGGGGFADGPDELLWRLKRAQALAQMGSWEWHIPTGQLLWSDEIFSLFGIPVDAFGASYPAFLDRVHPDDRALVEEAVRRAVEEGADYELDHRIVRPDGSSAAVKEASGLEDRW